MRKTTSTKVIIVTTSVRVPLSRRSPPAKVPVAAPMSCHVAFVASAFNLSFPFLAELAGPIELTTLLKVVLLRYRCYIATEKTLLRAAIDEYWMLLSPASNKRNGIFRLARCDAAARPTGPAPMTATGKDVKL